MRNTQTNNGKRFELGKVIWSKGILSLIEGPDKTACRKEIVTLLQRHTSGDFGMNGRLDEVPSTTAMSLDDIVKTGRLDQACNATVIARGSGPVYSEFKTKNSLEVLVITKLYGEATTTTVLLSEEY